MLKNFYVDDCLKSQPTNEATICLVNQLCEMLSRGGFRLTKWISNSRSVIESIPEEERAKNIKGLDLNLDPLPIEYTLGVQWETNIDTFGIKIKPVKKPSTRRGLLSKMLMVLYRM